MASFTSSSGAVSEPRRGVKSILRSYFYWEYPRGCVHYDVMVTLILLFIFVTPHLWDYGAKPTPVNGIAHPIQVSGYGTLGLIITVRASDVKIPAGASDYAVKEALRKAIEPVTGDAVFVERWKTITDAQGNLAWQVWAHR
ncbi:MAG: hypothetical protein ACLGPM_06945 [Acidobacteriota bacterium]